MPGKDVDAFVEINDVGADKDPAALEADSDLGTCDAAADRWNPRASTCWMRMVCMYSPVL
jgi:hypothetical protein